VGRGDARGCNGDALWVQSISNSGPDRLTIIALLLLGVIISRVITVLGHSDVGTHIARENGDGVIGAADLRGSLP
jgi:hypothetical protein